MEASQNSQYNAILVYKIAYCQFQEWSVVSAIMWLQTHCPLVAKMVSFSTQFRYTHTVYIHACRLHNCATARCRSYSATAIARGYDKYMRWITLVSVSDAHRLARERSVGHIRTFSSGHGGLNRVRRLAVLRESRAGIHRNCRNRTILPLIMGRRGTQFTVACRLPKPERTLVALPKARTSPWWLPRSSELARSEAVLIAEATTCTGAGRIGWGCTGAVPPTTDRIPCGRKTRNVLCHPRGELNEWMKAWKLLLERMEVHQMIGDWWVSDDRRDHEKVCVVLSAPESRLAGAKLAWDGSTRFRCCWR
jgi:hypothetical protein